MADGKVNKRIVAFLDVLGFRKRVLTEPPLQLGEQYEHVVSQIHAINRPVLRGNNVPTLFPHHPVDQPWCRRYIFSDSIILVSDDEDAVSCLKLLIYSWRIFQILLGVKWPIRGGIAFGDLYENTKLNVVLGPVLTTAYDLERNQNWIGVAIDESIVEQFPDIFLTTKHENSILNDVFLRYSVPFKDGTFKPLHTLNWRFNLVAADGTKALFGGADQANDLAKIKYALDYARNVVDSGRVYASGDNLPVELRMLYVGDLPPKNWTVAKESFRV